MGGAEHEAKQQWRRVHRVDVKRNDDRADVEDRGREQADPVDGALHPERDGLRGAGVRRIAGGPAQNEWPGQARDNLGLKSYFTLAPLRESTNFHG